MSDPLPPHNVVGQESVFSRVSASLRSSPDFRYLWLSNLFFVGGNWSLTLVLSWLIYDSTGSEFLLAVYSAVRLTPLWLGPVSGVIADRFDRVLIVKIATVWSFAIAALLALSVSVGYEPYWLLVAGGLLAGFAQSPSQPARASLTLELVGRKNIANANGLNSMAMGLLQGIAPAIGGVVISRFGVSVGLWYASGFYVVAMLFIWRIAPVVRTVRVEHEPILRMVVSGLRIILTSRLTATVLGITLAANLLVWPIYFSFMPVFAKDVLGLDATGLGWLLLCYGMGSFLGAFIMASLGNFRRKGAAFVYGSMALGACWALFGLSQHVTLSFLLIGCVGLMVATYSVMQTTLMLMTCPPEVQGRALGVQELAIGATPIAALAQGAIATSIGVGLMTFFAGALFVIVLVIMALRVPELVRYTGE